MTRQRAELLGGRARSPRRADAVPGQPADLVGPRLTGGRQRLVEQVEQDVVLPVAQAEGDREHRQADEQPAAELIEVVDDAEAILVADGPENLRHRVRSGALLGALGPGGAGPGGGGRLAGARLGLRHGPRLRQRGLVVVVLGLAGDPFLELTHPRPQAPADPGRRFGPRISRTMMRTTIASMPGLRNIASGPLQIGGTTSVAVGDRRGCVNADRSVDRAQARGPPGR